MSQTAAGVNIIKQNATYYAIEGVNVRSDCSTDAQIITGTTVGQALTSTGVSEDGQWVEVTVNNQTGYVSSQYVSNRGTGRYRRDRHDCTGCTVNHILYMHKETPDFM